jgi:hypothetical protein
LLRGQDLRDDLVLLDLRGRRNLDLEADGDLDEFALGLLIQIGGGQQRRTDGFGLRKIFVLMLVLGVVAKGLTVARATAAASALLPVRIRAMFGLQRSVSLVESDPSSSHEYDAKGEAAKLRGGDEHEGGCPGDSSTRLRWNQGESERGPLR